MTYVVMVHGAFCGGWAFDAFRASFESAGCQVVCPDLRGHGAGEPATALAGISMADYAADVATLCAGLPEPPVLLGHSMGGLVAQLAARRTPLNGLVLLAPSPPWGVAAGTLEEAATAFGVQLLGPFAGGALEPDRSLMARYSLDRLPGPERQAVAARLGCESARAVRETLNWWLDPFMTTGLGPGPLDTPSLVIVGERDVVHSPATGRAVADRIGAEFRLAPGMSHWLIGESGWSAVADQALDWISQTLRRAA
jgi:pimeloyl-ACP methyl ester carboxylesterase